MITRIAKLGITRRELTALITVPAIFCFFAQTMPSGMQITRPISKAVKLNLK